MSHTFDPLFGRRVAVTGASGFVGRALATQLAQRGAVVRAVSRAVMGPSRPGIEPVRVSGYTDRCAISSALAGCDLVFHLAARAHRLQDDAALADAAFREANVDAVHTVAAVAREVRAQRVVLVSSIGVLGPRTCGTAFDDRSEARPVGAYAESKLAGERALVEVLSGSSTAWTILRPPLVYGFDAPGNFGQLLTLVRRLPLVPLGGLQRRRSFVSLGNLCSALAWVAGHPAAAQGRFVLSDGDDLTVAELAREIAIGLGRQPGCVVDVSPRLLQAAAALIGRRATLSKLADELQVDGSRLRDVTGWRPPEGAREAIRAAARRSSLQAMAAQRLGDDTVRGA